jgi:hypothetical protein
MNARNAPAQILQLNGRVFIFFAAVPSEQTSDFTPNGLPGTKNYTEENESVCL